MKETPRVYGRTWMNIRAALMREEPLCRACAAQGNVTLAVEIDHIVPLHKGGHATEASNLQPLCKPCHEAKTAEDMGHKVKVEIGLDGWPVTGGG